MATQTIKTVFQIRRDTTANWSLFEDITPVAGEPCYDLDLHTLRVGDGITKYKDLPVIGGVESAEDLQAAIEQLQTQVGDTNIAEIQENYTNLTTQVNTFNTEITEMQQTLETKADAETVTELQTVVEQKADVETVTELQTIVETKLDAEAVEILETELKTYIDEVIQNVEAGDLDGGVIE
ncbi:MAG: hypothetical protein IJ444_01960 [Kiritimatiellae bacterium]|nr:hypothetical protein [Kiritimatiellia bacterium]